jgi:hypothetical protein
MRFAGFRAIQEEQRRGPAKRRVTIAEKKLVDVTGIEPATSCLQSTRSPS